MAHLWMKDDSRKWAVLDLQVAAIELQGAALDIGRFPPTGIEQPSAGTGAGATGKAQLLLVPFSEGKKSPSWALLWNHHTRVYVDSVLLTSGLRILFDREEIRLAANDPIYFAAVSPPRITTYTATEREIECMRCQSPLRQGDPVVVCPQCGITFHQNPDDPRRQCWIYSEKCNCSMQTDLDADFLWYPEHL